MSVACTCRSGVSGIQRWRWRCGVADGGYQTVEVEVWTRMSRMVSACAAASACEEQWVLTARGGCVGVRCAQGGAGSEGGAAELPALEAAAAPMGAGAELATMELTAADVAGAERALEFGATHEDAAAKGEEISLNGFGKFKVKASAEREGRNPSTGATITIAASKKLSFTPAKAVKDKLNG